MAATEGMNGSSIFGQQIKVRFFIKICRLEEENSKRITPGFSPCGVLSGYIMREIANLVLDCHSKITGNDVSKRF